MFHFVVLERAVMLHLYGAVQAKNSDMGQCITLYSKELEFSFKLEPFQKRLPSNSKQRN